MTAQIQDIEFYYGEENGNISTSNLLLSSALS